MSVGKRSFKLLAIGPVRGQKFLESRWLQWIHSRHKINHPSIGLLQDPASIIKHEMLDDRRDVKEYPTLGLELLGYQSRAGDHA